MREAPIIVEASDLGAPGAPDAALCASQVIRILAEAAGEGMRLASISLDVTSHPLGPDNVNVSVRIDKQARSIVFASCEARAGDKLVFSAQALFSRNT
jgi:hypothetical protein